MSVHISLRIPGPDLRTIDQLAKDLDMNRTNYMITASLGQLPSQRTELTNRVEQLEQTVERLQAWKQDVIDSQGNW